MACPGGCVSGAGHPTPRTPDVIATRQKVLLDIDLVSKERYSQNNEDVLELYKNFFGEVNSEKALLLLHTHYTNRKVQNGEEDKADESVWVTKTIEVCVDKKCYEKGSYAVIEEIQRSIKNLQLDYFYRILPIMHSGNTESNHIYVALDGKRVSEEHLGNIEKWLLEESNN